MFIFWNIILGLYYSQKLPFGISNRERNASIRVSSGSNACVSCLIKREMHNSRFTTSPRKYLFLNDRCERAIIASTRLNEISFRFIQNRDIKSSARTREQIARTKPLKLPIKDFICHRPPTPPPPFYATPFTPLKSIIRCLSNGPFKTGK